MAPRTHSTRASMNFPSKRQFSHLRMLQTWNLSVFWNVLNSFFFFPFLISPPLTITFNRRSLSLFSFSVWIISTGFQRCRKGYRLGKEKRDEIWPSMCHSLHINSLGEGTYRLQITPSYGLNFLYKTIGRFHTRVFAKTLVSIPLPAEFHPVLNSMIYQKSWVYRN